ncbi:MAG: hypothetical protein KDJ15_04795 [Alphaproteobacteria bacterium]|nr:hypothetical protein [Alphaproteobacteria bacterium]
MRHDPTLGDVLKDIWRLKGFVAGGACLGGLIALGFLIFAVPQYKTTMLIGPAADNSLHFRPAALPDSGGGPPPRRTEEPSSDNFTRFYTILQGRTVAAALFPDEKIRRGIAADRPFRFSRPPSLSSPESLAAYLQKNIKIEPVGMTALKRVVYLHQDPAFGPYLLTRLQGAADRTIRVETQNRNAERITWLTGALARTLHPDHKKAIGLLLLEQEQIRMILAMEEPFAATVVEPAATGPRPYWPRKTLITLASLAIGAFFGYLVGAARRPEV